MSAFHNKLADIRYHFDNGNESLAYRMLVDAVLDTADTTNFSETIALAAWQENNPDNHSGFRERANALIEKLQNQTILQAIDNQILLKADRISKAYGKGTFTLGPISLEIRSGQMIGLVGENGNGKTTLLRMLAKDLRVTDGQLSFPFARAGQNDYELRTKLTYIPQRTPRWYGRVIDNLKLTAAHYGIAPAANEKWVLMLIIRFGLWTFRHHRWSELSSGYKMRFELARTFLRKPTLLLLDEPLGNLDILSQQLILEDLRMLGKSLVCPLGIVLSSQQLYEVEKVSDEVIFLKNGMPSSFNKLRDQAMESKQNFVAEIEISNSKEELMAALHAFTLVDIRFLGSNYFIELQSCDAGSFLQQLTQAQIHIKYFRDISFSTRRFFNQ